MSWSLLDAPLRGAEAIWQQPQRQAETAKTLMELPLTQAQTEYTKAGTTKTLIDAQMNYLQGMAGYQWYTGQGQGGESGRYTGQLPQAEEGSPAGGATPPPAEGGGAHVTPGPTPNPGDSTGATLAFTHATGMGPDQYAWLGPRTAGSAMQTGAQPPQSTAAQLASYSGSPMGSAQERAAPTSMALARAAAPDQGIFLGGANAEPVPGYSGGVTASPQPPPIGGTFQDVPGAFRPGQGGGGGTPGAAPGAGPQIPPGLQLPPGLQRQLQQHGIPDFTTQPLPQGLPTSGQMQQMGPPSGVWEPAIGKFVPVWMDKGFRLSILRGQSFPDAARWLTEQRNNAVLSHLQAVHDLPAWQREVDEAYRDGLLTDSEYAHVRNRPELQGAIRRENTPPEQVERRDAEEAMYNHNIWDGQKYVFNPTAATQWLTEHFHPGAPGPGGGWIPSLPGTPILPPGATPGAPGTNAPGPQGGTAPGSATAGPASFDTYATTLHGHEGYSDTQGSYGWQPGTKVEVARQALGNQVAGMSDAQIQAMKLTPQQEDAMLRTFTETNARKLAQIGQRPSAAALFLAHYLGAAGVDRLRQLPRGTVLASVPAFQAAVAANQQELGNGMTAGRLADEAKRLFGNDTIDYAAIRGDGGPTVAPTNAAPARGPSPAPAPAAAPRPGFGPDAFRPQGAPPPPAPPPPAPAPAVAPPAAAPVATPGPPPSTLPFGMQAQPQKTPEQHNLELHNIDNDNAAVSDAGKVAAAAANPMRVLRDMQAEAVRAGPGAFGTGAEMRTAILGAVRTAFGNSPAGQAFIERWTGADLSTVPAREDFMKQTVNLLAQQEAALPGVRVGIGLSQMLHGGTPNLNMQQATVLQMLNFALVGFQRSIDYYDDLNKGVSEAGSKYQNNPWYSAYTPVERGVTNQWTGGQSVHSPLVYEAAIRFLNGDAKWMDKLDASTPLGRDQQTEALSIARRAVPNAVVKLGTQ